MNRAAQELFGCPEDMRTVQISAIFPAYSFSEDCRNIRIKQERAGLTHTYLLSQTPIKKDDVSFGKIILIRDITDLTTIEDELLHARHIESLGQLAAGIAHDFNNLLAGISFCFEAIKNSDGNPRQQADIIKDGEHAVEKAVQLTRQLITFSKGGAPNPESVNIKEVLEESLRFSLRGSNVDFKLVCPPDLRAVHGDKNQLSQVLHNLALNARQAMPTGGRICVRTDNVTIETGAHALLPAGNYVQIQMQDAGCGISAENLAKIFTPYFTTKPSGTGLGLTTAYSIVRKHDGHISVTSQPGKGACFVVLLPASTSVPLKQPERTIVPKVTKGRVLIMDDESTIRQTLRLLLQRIGFTVDSAANGAEAVTLFEQTVQRGEAYAVVITDLTVPGGMGGKELCDVLHARDPALKVILSSGYATDPIMSMLAEYGFAAALIKPYRLAELTSVIDSVLADQQKA
jgi:signal transduction histidine kinase/CheY-like chemotaxis protein